MEKIGSRRNIGKNSAVNIVRGILTFTAVVAVTISSVPATIACGPGFIEPVFAFERSPDIPFEEYTGGNIGIVRPKFGRKSLVIAYRYLNGGGFSADEQKQLVDALRAKEPEEGSEDVALKAWLEARKEVLPDEKTPDIYTDRPGMGGYNFFPNCTANAFEVATKTLQERAGSHGADDRYVREWLAGQDRVFDICSSGSTLPAEIAPEMPDWLKKDRAYQIAAAHFYSLNFREARRRFEEIAADNDSVWQRTADYLIGRTLVREASLAKNAARQRSVYEQAEQHLESVLQRGGQYADAAEQLLNLVKYRIRPHERFAELSRVLAHVGGNRNLRQDVIDYTWLFDKFEAEIAKAIEEQKRKPEASPEGPPANSNTSPNTNSVSVSDWERERDAIEKGEMIRIGFSYAVPEQSYPAYVSVVLPFDATNEQVIAAFAERLGRQIKKDEAGKIIEAKESALEQRKYFLGANYRFEQARSGRYEGERYSDTELTSDAIPEFITASDLSDWMITLHIDDDLAFKRSLAKYDESRSNAWLVAALTKAKKDSPGVETLIADGVKIGRSSAAYPTVIYHLARLKLEQGKDAEAGKLLDGLIASGLTGFPISAQNMLLELRMGVAQTLDEFLRFAARRPVTFNNSGHTYGRLRDFLENEKSYWNKDYYKESREEYVRNLEREYAEILPWDDRSMFDERTIDIFNGHFPIDLLADAALSKEIPEHLRSDMILTVWTRAVLLGRTDISARFAKEAVKSVPDMAETFKAYLSIKTPVAKRNEELWILIKNPKLSPFVEGGVPNRGDNEASSWEDGWWFEPSDTYYDRGDELPKSIPKPSFVTARQSAAARTERGRISAEGDAETYLTERVLEWAAAQPRDARVPEALYVVAVINLTTKYGSGVQENREMAIKLLESRYPRSPWTAKAKEEVY